MKMLRTIDCWTASARSWKTVSMPASRERAAFQAVTGLPRTRISPLVGLTTPERILISVDLPAPLSPIRPTTSLSLTERLTPPRAKTLPYDFLMSRSSISFSGTDRSSFLGPPAGYPGRRLLAQRSASVASLATIS